MIPPVSIEPSKARHILHVLASVGNPRIQPLSMRHGISSETPVKAEYFAESSFQVTHRLEVNACLTLVGKGAYRELPFG
ncbi:MAG: hypothetical protein K0Q96_237 [Rubrobacteraceae bacterium]|nr:hypothetical protein [Rubrobacteraceae bacterium]